MREDIAKPQRYARQYSTGGIKRAKDGAFVRFKDYARLLEILESVEWVQPMYNGSRSCSYCGNQSHWGHTDDCVFARATPDRRGRA